MTIKSPSPSPSPSSPLFGFTLLEVIITIALLTTLVLSISTLMRSSLDMRLGLSEQAQVTSRLNVAMTILSQDLEQAYMLSVNDDKVRLTDGSTPTYFQVNNISGATTLKFTTLNGTESISGAPAGELIEVNYSIEPSRQFETRNALYRGHRTLGVTTDIVTAPIVEGIATLSLEMWNGESWLRDWDTDKTEFKQSIPHLLRLSIQAYPEDPSLEGDEYVDNLTQDLTDLSTVESALGIRRTIIYLSWARRFNELKAKPTTLKF